MAVHSSVNGTTAIPWRGSRKRPSLLEQLKGCQRGWCPGAPWDREAAHAAVHGTPAGCFLVVQDGTTSLPSLLCVSAGGDHGTVLEYHIKNTDTVLQLCDSRLSFSDLAQLVLFYSLTRDVLDVCLSIPSFIYSGTDKSNVCLSQLDPKVWLSSTPEQQADEMTLREPSSVMCSIQLTSTNGALCVINPLYIRDHGDDWLTSRERSARCAALSSYRRERRLSSTRTWTGSGLASKRSASLDQESHRVNEESSGLTRAKSADSPCYPATPGDEAGVILRRPSRDYPSSPLYRASTGSLCPSPPSTAKSLNRSVPNLLHHSSLIPQSPHRVSWIEDGVWLPPPRPTSSLLPPSLELDSLSVSSIEEEQESPMPSPSPQQGSAQRLADKVIHRLSVVGQALGGLVCPKKRLINRVIELSERKGGTFAEAVKGFVAVTEKAGADFCGRTRAEFLQEVRSGLTSLRETLLDRPDILALLDSMTDLSDQEIDSLVELSIHKVALKPVSEHLYSCILTSRTDDGSLARLKNNMSMLEKNDVEELGGSAGVGVPDLVSLERIQHRWASIHEAYSPNKKVQILLKVCKSIYHSMSANSSEGRVFGADDFLPCLTWVLLRSDVVTLQLDTDYMMELLDPTQLQGEGGYYLTSLYASLYYISSFCPRLAVRQLSVEAQQSLNQWHRRRTLHCNQARRSKHRRTIRRTVREKAAQNSEAGTGNAEKEGKEKDCVDAAEFQLRGSDAGALQPLKEEARDEGRSRASSSASDFAQKKTITRQEGDGQIGCTADKAVEEEQ